MSKLPTIQPQTRSHQAKTLAESPPGTWCWVVGLRVPQTTYANQKGLFQSHIWVPGLFPAGYLPYLPARREPKQEFLLELLLEACQDIGYEIAPLLMPTKCFATLDVVAYEYPQIPTDYICGNCGHITTSLLIVPNCCIECGAKHEEIDMNAQAAEIDRRNGAGSTYSTFCNDFNYQPQAGEMREKTYEKVIRLIELTKHED